jgi:hypothetical protein
VTAQDEPANPWKNGESLMGTKIEISADILWGMLLLSWATGKNHLTPGRASPALPRTMEDLQKQASEIGLTITFPDGMLGVQFVEFSSETIVMKLPPKEMVEATEAELLAGLQYPMPQFYDDFYDTRLPKMTTEAALDLHAARIGDYAVRFSE